MEEEQLEILGEFADDVSLLCQEIISLREEVKQMSDENEDLRDELDR